ncbi:hypothetical protein ASG72_09985 [Bosea sp. Leaf344]|uniref:methyl-accepting chemotaxis protein n=1 Tax=Bosea sp. Leaf344 TaxID=1736346 RepID=UPI0007126B7D|nr:methyl-accepting chemotaxis protein [Bosea sp. Leaf344]KQU51825.1 hypothetical protein ASG72_09985 [Bosea sp. Leaf344]
MGNFVGSLSSLSLRLPMLFLAACLAIGTAAMLAAHGAITAQAGPAAAQIDSALAAAMPRLVAIGLASLALLGLVGLLLARRIGSRLSALREAALRIAEGASDAGLPALGNAGEIGELAQALGAVHAAGVEAARIRAALDGCRTSMMVCDERNRVVYVNASLLKFFTEAQEDFRIAFPGCSAKDMLGKVMEGVQREPGSALPGAQGSLRYVLGRRTVALTLTPVADSQGRRLGTSVEWLELTDELAAAAEVAAMVAAAGEGDFSRRAALTGKPETLQAIAAGVNQINALVEGAVAEFSQVLGALAEGDLTQRMQGAYRGRLDELKQSLNGTLDRLGDTVATIQSTAGQVSRAAQEISSGAGDLAARTEATAVNLEETAATTEQLAASVKQSAARSREATEMAGTAMAMASDGKAVVSQTVGAIERIEASSSRISDIVTVIDEIAFQTNLLALNAAVEAARAGDAGKGFAVVASEVRALAQRSGQAAKDIKGLILSSNEQVGEGVRHVRETGDALDRIVAAAGRVSEIIAEISSATARQAQGIHEMSQAVADMDGSTQQNAALAEQSAGSATELMEEIAALRDLVGFFRTGTEAAEIARRAPVPPRQRPPQPAEPVRQPVPRRAEPSRPDGASAEKAVPRKRVANAGRTEQWSEF